jgi:hypothetical protein
MPNVHSRRDACPRKCPLDGSALVGLNVTCPKGWGFFNPDLKLSEDFCPRCDVAFLTLDDSRAKGGGIQVLSWKRVGGELTPCQPDREGLIKLSEKIWEVHKTLLSYHVASFVYDRSKLPSYLRCRNDGAQIRVIGVIPYDADVWIALAWCKYCKVGFGQLSNPLYGWRDAVKFTYDVERRTYRASLTGSRELSVARIEDRLNEVIVPDQNGVPGDLASLATPMDIEDTPVPVEPPASLWDGWLEGFEPGFLAKASARDWRRHQ